MLERREKKVELGPHPFFFSLSFTAPFFLSLCRGRFRNAKIEISNPLGLDSTTPTITFLALNRLPQSTLHSKHVCRVDQRDG